MPGGQNICMVKLPHYMSSRYREEADIQPYQYPTLALGEGGRSVPHPSYFAPREETQSSLYRRLGGFQEQSGWVWEISFHQGLRLLSPQ
jgi:hypothetical protein